ncbi:MAG: hypothetical protein AAGA18_15290 [Verrucomicrobiota bacterium]
MKYNTFIKFTICATAVLVHLSGISQEPLKPRKLIKSDPLIYQQPVANLASTSNNQQGYYTAPV